VITAAGARHLDGRTYTYLHMCVYVCVYIQLAETEGGGAYIYLIDTVFCNLHLEGSWGDRWSGSQTPDLGECERVLDARCVLLTDTCCSVRPTHDPRS